MNHICTPKHVLEKQIEELEKENKEVLSYGGKHIHNEGKIEAYKNVLKGVQNNG
jgi:hypothetical protein